MNCIGCLIRMFASFSVKAKYRYWMALCGQVIAGISQPLVLAMPTKLAAQWFGDNERTLANTMASLGKLLTFLSHLVIFFMFDLFCYKLLLLLNFIP